VVTEQGILPVIGRALCAEVLAALYAQIDGRFIDNAVAQAHGARCTHDTRERLDVNGRQRRLGA